LCELLARSTTPCGTTTRWSRRWRLSGIGIGGVAAGTQGPSGADLRTRHHPVAAARPSPPASRLPVVVYLMLRNLRSMQNYFQAAFRCSRLVHQEPHRRQSKRGGKPQAGRFVFDFAQRARCAACRGRDGLSPNEPQTRRTQSRISCLFLDPFVARTTGGANMTRSISWRRKILDIADGPDHLGPLLARSGRVRPRERGQGTLATHVENPEGGWLAVETAIAWRSWENIIATIIQPRARW